ncbi:MAG TPA: cytochrome c [Pseudolabrys sp.]|nr:cytochrome c [Pseudolabrys sp.]
MLPRSRAHIAAAVFISFGALTPVYAADDTAPPNDQSLTATPGTNPVQPTANHLLSVPLVRNLPGAVSTGPMPQNPMAGDPNSAQRGMEYFNKFNCVGCHMSNGGGGMGPALSNSFFKFGSDPAQIFLVISHGAPLGMPAWGTILPTNVIWDIVSYVQSISKEPTGWGTTVSIAQHEPAIEQVPAEFKETSQPWNYTEPFSMGQKPTKHNPTSMIGQDTPDSSGPQP